MVFDSDFCCIFNLAHRLSAKIGNHSGTHRNRRTDFCLTAALCTGNRGIFLNQISKQTCHLQTVAELFSGYSQNAVIIAYQRRQNAAASQRWSGDCHTS